MVEFFINIHTQRTVQVPAIKSQGPREVQVMHWRDFMSKAAKLENSAEIERMSRAVTSGMCASLVYFFVLAFVSFCGSVKFRVPIFAPNIWRAST